MNQFAFWDDYRKFASAVRYQQRYIRTPKTEGFLEMVRRSAEARASILSKGYRRIWRAQLGSCEVEVERDGTVYDETQAYPPTRMKPRMRIGREGRINPKGIPCFYGATSRETAMAETRPWVGEVVSVGQFEVLEDVRLVDCSKNQSKRRWHPLIDKPIGFDLSSLSSTEVEDVVWTDIDHAFSEPVTENDNLPDYIPTQILAEVFKAEGYGGIAYKSMLTEDGYNLAFFDPSILKQILGELYETEKVQFKFSENPVDQYFFNEQGNTVRMVVTAVRAAPS
jgi:hypothetical protein